MHRSCDQRFFMKVSCTHTTHLFFSFTEALNVSQIFLPYKITLNFFSTINLTGFHPQIPSYIYPKLFQVIKFYCICIVLKSNGPVMAVTYLYQRVNITFRSSEFCWILHIDLDVEVKVVPHVVFTINVVFKIDCFIVEARTS